MGRYDGKRVVITGGTSGMGLATVELNGEMLTVDAKGPYFTVQQFVPLLAKGSAVVLTTSIVNVMGFPSVSAYSAAKTALRSMTRTLAAELFPT